MAKYQQYAEYKDSGVEWLGKIPSHWTMSKLRYLFDFSKGLSITKENLQDEGIPCVNYGEVHSKYGFEVDPKKHLLKCVSENYLKTSENALLNNGDFVFADTSEDLKGSGNFTHLVGDEQIFAGYHTVIARPHNANASRFYAYLFESKEFRSQIHLAVKGVKVFSITQAMLRSANAWLPSTDEQVKIANFLDYETSKIDNLIERQQQLIQLLKEKRQAVISHAVTKGLNPDVPMKDSGVEWLGQVPEHWTISFIKYILAKEKDAMVDGPFGSSVNTATDYVEEGIPVIRTVNITNDGFSSDNLKFMRPAKFEELKRHSVKPRDVLFSKVGTIGNACIFPENIDVGILSTTGSCKISININLIDREFLVYQIHSMNQELMQIANANVQPFLNMTNIKNLRISLPPLAEQQLIINLLKKRLVRFDELISKAQSAIQLMQERRTALISAAVTGKIDVRNWQDPTEAKMEFSA